MMNIDEDIFVDKDLRDVISPKELSHIFSAIAAKENMHFQYLNKGCAPRAHLMCVSLQEEFKVKAKKAWALETIQNRLHGNVCGKAFSWEYHVALAVDVMHADMLKTLVVDPSIFDGPVLVNDWVKVMNVGVRQAQLLPFGAVPEGCTGDFDTVIKTNNYTTTFASKAMQNLAWIAVSEKNCAVLPSKFEEKFLTGINKP